MFAHRHLLPPLLVCLSVCAAQGINTNKTQLIHLAYLNFYRYLLYYLLFFEYTLYNCCFYLDLPKHNRHFFP